MTNLRNQHQVNDAQALLIFPPLVTTNFGNYYPSTAALFVTEDDPRNVPLRFANEYVDVQKTDGGFQCYHALTRENFSVDADFDQLLETFHSGRTFERSHLTSCFTSEVEGDAFFEELVEHRMFMR